MENSLVYGVIHIGSSTLSMQIVDYRSADDIRVIEEVRKETNFGEEVFVNRQLSFASIRRLCDMLNGLKQLLADYHVEEYVVYATAVFREAANRRAITDLVRTATGFDVIVIDMPQEIYFKHFDLQYSLKRINKRRNYELGTDFLYVDITSGCVGLTVWEKGALKYQHNVHIGTLRLLETFRLNQRESMDFPQAMTEYIHAIMKPLWDVINRYHPAAVVLSGREARIIADLMKIDLSHDNMAEVAPAEFQRFYETAGMLSASHTKQKYHISDQWAQAVLPTTHIYKEILDNVPVDKVIMMGTTFIEAAAMFYGAMKTKDKALSYMRAQNLELTRSIAQSYYYEADHVKTLELFSHAIIKGLRERSGLTERDEFLLRMAIILYQVGKYVNLLESHVHGWNLIRGTDIFGISDKEKDMVAAIVYYDHKGNPNDDDEPFRILSDEAKMTVLKLISIFRLVRAMDLSRKQKMKDVTARIAGGAFVIEYDSQYITALETWMFDKNKEFFENVYGIEAKLERR